MSERSQLSLAAGSVRSCELTVLGQRRQGTRFLSLSARSVLNSALRTEAGRLKLVWLQWRHDLEQPATLVERAASLPAKR